MLSFITSRLQESSTWRGIILLLTAVGVHMSPELQEQIITTGLAFAGLFGVLSPDITRDYNQGNTQVNTEGSWLLYKGSVGGHNEYYILYNF